MPLLRILVESYFHLCYVTNLTHKEEVIRNYDLLNKYQLKQVLNNRVGYKIVFQEPVDKVLFDEVKKAVSKVKEKDVLIFKNIYNLAKKTNNLNIYYGIYKKLNSYVHYNPITFISYGAMDDQKSFQFASMQPQPQRECEFLYYVIEVTTRVLITAINFLGVEYKKEMWVFELFTEWEELKREYREIFHN